jgi:hypothetical protein
MPGQKTASSFFKFHGETGRDFMFGLENIFSVEIGSLARENETLVRLGTS